jgi:hypothetical protein
MTMPAPHLDYATPAAPPNRRPLFAVFAVAIALAFLGAGPFSAAIGFPPIPNVNEPEAGPVFGHIAAGFLIFLLVIALAGPLARLIREIIRRVEQTQAKPAQPVVLTLIICGTLCVLGAMGMELYLVRYGESVMTAAGIGGLGQGMERVSVGVETPILGHAVAILGLVAGVGLASVGFWGGLGSHQIKETSNAGA